MLISNLSFREKTLWVNLVTTSLLFGYYFVVVFKNGFGGEQATGFYLTIVFWTIVIQVVAVSLIAAFVKPDMEDDRVHRIAAKSFNWAYCFLLVGVGATLWHVVAGALGDSVEEHPEMGARVAETLAKLSDCASPFVVIHILLGTLVLAEMAKAGAQLFFYRRGI